MISFRAVAATATTTFLLCSVALAATPHSGHFTGKTSSSGGQPLTFSVSGNKVRRLEVGFAVTCKNGAGLGESDSVGGTFVIRDGRFSGTKHITSTVHQNPADTAKVTGRFTSPRRASGTVRLRVTYADEGVEGAGGVCDTGTLKWSAHLG